MLSFEDDDTVSDPSMDTPEMFQEENRGTGAKMFGDNNESQGTQRSESVHSAREAEEVHAYKS